MDDYINTVAPAWAAAIITASGNDHSTTTWANAWAAYMEAVVSDTESAAGLEDAVFQSTEDEMLDLGPGLAAQVSAADKTLADQAGAAEITQVTNDASAVVAYDGQVVPAAATLAKSNIDDARTETTKEINADKQDGETHALDEDTRDKKYSAAQLAFLQAVDPQIATDDEAERTKSASDTADAANDEASAIKKADAATETEVDHLVTAGETEVDKEANANKTYTKAMVKNQVDADNQEASDTTTAVAAEPDTDFPEGKTIGTPGIYIDIDSYHSDFWLPLFDPSDGKLVGYKFFSFGPGPDMGWFDIGGYIGYTRGKFITDVKPATFNLELTSDWFVPTTMDGLDKMLSFANKVSFAKLTNYNLINGKTCTGFVVDTMDEAKLLPKYVPLFWTSGGELNDVMINLMPVAVKLPGYRTGLLPSTGWDSPWPN